MELHKPSATFDLCLFVVVKRRTLARPSVSLPHSRSVKRLPNQARPSWHRDDISGLRWHQQPPRVHVTQGGHHTLPDESGVEEFTHDEIKAICMCGSSAHPRHCQGTCGRTMPPIEGENSIGEQMKGCNVES